MLRIRLFGGMEVTGADHRPRRLPTRGARDLLAYLALASERRHAREVVAGRLWGDRTDGAARKALRNALWRLRRALEGADGGRAADEILQVDDLQVGLGQGVWVDAGEFRHHAALLPADGWEAPAPGCVAALGRAATLYRGDLLDEIYEPWAAERREELRLLHLDVLEALFRHEERVGNLPAAVGRARTLLRHDPLVERVHRGLMRCHWRMGDRPLAVRQYRRCEAVLQDELGLEPMARTRALLGRIVRGEEPPEGPTSPPHSYRSASMGSTREARRAGR